MDLLEKIISTRPSFHASETEVQRTFAPSESLLPESQARKLAAAGLTCYGIEESVLRFIARHVSAGSRTLETGAGCSTLVFAIQKAYHTTVTPSANEIRLIGEYAGKHGIAMDRVTFVQKPSEEYLPVSDLSDLDLVLLDGKHAFPWPMIDWFFTADRLKKGGVLLLDDAKTRSVAILAEFMAMDPGWEFVESFAGKTLAFRKIRDRVLDVAWHMQPWTLATPPQPTQSLSSRVRAKLAAVLRG